jgi:hypothetical protein
MTGPRDEPTAEQPAVTPTVSTAPPQRMRRRWSAIPSHLGRARTSTIVLGVLFLALGTLYLNIRPGPTGAVTTGSNTGFESPAGPTTPGPTRPAPRTTEPAPTTEAPTSSQSPTSSEPPTSSEGTRTTGPGSSTVGGATTTPRTPTPTPTPTSALPVPTTGTTPTS